MKKLDRLVSRGGLILGLMAMLVAPVITKADVSLDDWVPIFKGIDHATGRMTPGGGDSKLMVVQFLRIDLTDPDIQLLATPPSTNYQARVQETLGQSVSSFLQDNKLQVAVNANFYAPSDPAQPGQPTQIKGLHISRGFTVSAQDSPAEDFAVLFTTNNQVRWAFDNYPPTNTAGIYNAVSGRYPLVRDGVSVANNATSPIAGDDPRTAIGSSEDGRYLFLLTIDGRQLSTGWSQGAEDEDTADWMLRAGAHTAVMLDGGGSATMVMDCLGSPVRLNRPSILLQPPYRERYVASHFGVFAKPLSGFIENLSLRKARTEATLTFTTQSKAIAFVEYGTSTLYGAQTDVESVASLTHSITLTGLQPDSTYFFRIHATDESTQEFFLSNCFLLNATVIPVFAFSQSWKYETNNLDGVQWTAKGYNDSGWKGEGPGLLYGDDNPAIAPKGTPLPAFSNAGTSTARIPITYYFRTHFNFTNSTAGVSLLFSNYIDDGAVFYLNGTEIQRVRMDPAPAEILNTTLASGNNGNACGGDAITTCPAVFWVGPESLASLVKGDNVLAAEVHNYNAASPDVVFGTDLRYSPGPEVVGPTAPTITTDPASKTVNAGQSASFSVVASGSDPLSYSWYFNGSAIAGGNGSTFTIAAAAAGNAGGYRAVVSNASGSVTSAVATLTVVLPPSITTQPASQSIVAGKPVTFTVAASGTAPLAYAWSHDGVPIGGETSSSLTLPSVSASDAGSYSVAVSNAAGSVTSAAATLTVILPPVITTHPAAVAVEASKPASFSVSATGSAPLSYAWSLNGTPIAGATQSTYSIASASASDVGSYTVKISNAAGSVTSQGAALTLVSVTPPVLSVASAADGRFVINWNGTGFFLQQADDIGVNPIPWTDVPGPVTSGAYTNAVDGSRRFFRLRN